MADPRLPGWQGLPGEVVTGFAPDPSDPTGRRGWYVTNLGGIHAAAGARSPDLGGGSYLGGVRQYDEARSGARTFGGRIEAGPSGVTIYSTNNEGYTFGFSQPQAPPPAPATSPERMAEKARLDALFAEMGLRGLGEWGFDLLKRDVPIEQIRMELWQRPEYKARFPAMEVLRNKGRPFSEAQYIEYERSVSSMLRQADIRLYEDPKAFSDYVAGNLARDVALPEVQRRIEDGFVRASQAPAEVQAFYASAYGASGMSALAQEFLDPQRSLVENERRLRTAVVGGMGRRFGFDIGREVAERLEGRLGLDEQASQQLFAGAARQLPRLNELIDRFNDPEDDLSLEEYADAIVLRTPEELNTISRLLARRRAQFSASGGAARTGAGALVGLQQR